MFSIDTEITPELEADLKRADIIIAHSWNEVSLKSETLKDPLSALTASQNLDHLLLRWEGYDTTWAELKGKKVLELASGSIFSRNFLCTYYPHFSRLCSLNGADVIAMDINPQGKLDQQLFTGVKVDIINLVMEGGLHNHPLLSKATFDIINSTNFVGWNMLPDVEDYLRSTTPRITREEFENKLLKQCAELLSEEGIMTIDTRDRNYMPIYYVKSEGQLIKLPD